MIRHFWEIIVFALKVPKEKCYDCGKMVRYWKGSSQIHLSLDKEIPYDNWIFECFKCNPKKK